MPYQNIISKDTIIIRNNELFMSDIDDELICLDEKSGCYYGLNYIGKMIWEMIAGPLSVQKIIENLQEQYPSVLTLADEVVNYLHELYYANEKNRLIEIIN